jgi:hypothetical protein
MFETALGDVALWHRLYLAAKSSHVGVDMDTLACLVHRAPSYGLLLSDEGSGLLVRHGLVSSCHNGRWHLFEGGGG